VTALVQLGRYTSAWWQVSDTPSGLTGTIPAIHILGPYASPWRTTIVTVSRMVIIAAPFSLAGGSSLNSLSSQPRSGSINFGARRSSAHC
jgi:hypothetical protein